MNIRKFAIVPLAALALACGKDDAKVDDALNNDLSLAAQARNGQNMDSISAVERAYVAPAAAAPVRSSVSSAPRRTTTTRRTSSSSSGTRTSSSSGVYTPPAPARTTTVKHTKRDAAIGATAGAVIGATTSKNKTRGAIIGAAAGGILGAVIGNNVDKKEVPQQ